ncbi:uncharacterized protein LOC134250552 isoform X1 [Saccostrea cucullata]|uniref:uncharacterized protein LOC134250552 isoform X1 n=1 Tax=Saccostrea cuccullata TaxID=36930 RepID=UPI002ED0840C
MTFSQQQNMRKIIVKLLILYGNLILSDATITHICSECVKCNNKDSCCKSCIPTKVCAPNNYVNDEDSGSTDDFTDDFTDDRDVHVECQKCTACDSKYVCFERFFSPQTSRCTEMSKKDFSSILPDDKLIVTQISSTASPSLFTDEKSSRNTPPSSESMFCASYIILHFYRPDITIRGLLRNY